MAAIYEFFIVFNSFSFFSAVFFYCPKLIYDIFLFSFLFFACVPFFQYELRLAASDNLKENYTTVVIHVKDVNDNPPVFERPTYRTQITEEDDRNLPKRVLQVLKIQFIACVFCVVVLVLCCIFFYRIYFYLAESHVILFVFLSFCVFLYTFAFTEIYHIYIAFNCTYIYL